MPSYYQPPLPSPTVNVPAATVIAGGGAVVQMPVSPPTQQQPTMSAANQPAVTAGSGPTATKLKRSLLSSKEVHLLLLHASRLGDVHALRSLLRSPKMTPHMADDHGRTPLMFAAFGGHEECVLFLLGRGAMVHETDFAGKTAMHYACSKGYGHIVALLLKSGANTWLDDHRGQCALHAVAEQESVDALDLVWRYARGQIKDNQQAIARKMELYLERRRQWRRLAAANRGGNHDSDDDDDQMTLESVAKHRHIDTHDDDGLTPLMCAVIKGNLEVVKALVGYGADLMSEAAGGRTVIALSFVSHCL